MLFYFFTQKKKICKKRQHLSRLFCVYIYYSNLFEIIINTIVVSTLHSIITFISVWNKYYKSLSCSCQKYSISVFQIQYIITAVYVIPLCSFKIEVVKPIVCQP